MSHKQRINVYEIVNSYDTFAFYAVVAQLVRALVCGTRGRRFKSHQPYQKILLKMDVQDEQTLAKDIGSTTVAAWGHNIVQKMHGMKSKKRIKRALRFSFKNWASPLSLMRSHYASFT